jgi:hypothetical protein
MSQREETLFSSSVVSSFSWREEVFSPHGEEAHSQMLMRIVSL